MTVLLKSGKPFIQMASEDKDQSKLFQKVPSDDPYFKMNEVAQQMNNVPKSWMVGPSECSTNFDLADVQTLLDYWYHYFQIRTCDQYFDEYKACKSYKGRLYQRYSKYSLYNLSPSDLLLHIIHSFRIIRDSIDWIFCEIIYSVIKFTQSSYAYIDYSEDPNNGRALNKSIG